MILPIRALAGVATVLAATVPALAQSDGAAPSLQKLTEPQDDYPDISPDGRTIVFQSNRSGTWQLWLINADGSGLRRLTHSGANDRTPAWSPDGSRIVFSSDRMSDPGAGADARNIFVMDVSAGLDAGEAKVRQVLSHAGQDIHPKWTRDGRAIVFNRVYDSRDGADIYLIDSDGSNLRRAELGRGWNTYAGLTPDGARLVFRGTLREERDGASFENSDIYSAAPDGSGLARLTDDQAFDGWPAISPDGSQIAFSSRRAEGRFHVFLMPVGGGEPRQLTFGGDYNYTQPAWSPDGERLAVYRWTQDSVAEIGHIVWLDT